MHATHVKKSTRLLGDIAAAVGLKDTGGLYVVKRMTLSWNQWNSLNQLFTYQ